MSDKTGIQWTDATWSPVTGCTRVSDGCTNCYIERTPPFRMAHRHFDQEGIGGTTGVQLHPERLAIPFKWRKPRRIFVCSMADLFHDDVPDGFIGDVFNTMALAERHTFQILTKRPARMRSLLRKWEREAAESEPMRDARQKACWRRTDMMWCSTQVWPLPNVWLGVSAEDQKWADIRVPVLLDTPAAVRFVSVEPLLGPIDLSDELLWKATPCPNGCGCSRPEDPDRNDCACDGPCSMDFDWGHRPPDLQWVIVGGESGRKARPMHPDWARALRDQCTDAGVAFLFKQHGEWIEDATEYPANPDIGIHEPYRVLNIPPDGNRDRARCVMNGNGSTAMHPGNRFNPFAAGHPGWTAMRRVGKKAAGRELDGRTWDEYPAVSS